MQKVKSTHFVAVLKDDCWEVTMRGLFTGAAMAEFADWIDSIRDEHFLGERFNDVFLFDAQELEGVKSNITSELDDLERKHEVYAAASAEPTLEELGSFWA